MTILFVAGTRPEVIKLAPILWNLSRDEYILVWSGQHYDYEMSKVFFNQLGVPEPDLDLNAGSGSHAEQTAKILVGVEKSIERLKPRLVVALGDTNTVVATALASAKTLTPFVHIEAGMRSWDRTMPEEVNRIIADHVAELLIAFTKTAQTYLALEGIPLERIVVTGSTEVDVLMKMRGQIEKSAETMLEKLGLEKRSYVVVTVHRQSNVDDPEKLKEILEALIEIANTYTVVFPVHPRTKRRIQEYGLQHLLNYQRIITTEPLGFVEFSGLLTHARAVLTDSGGVQVDACTLGIPVLVLRTNTEYPECVMEGIAELTHIRKDKILRKFEELLNRRVQISENLLGDGKAGERIVKALREFRHYIESPDLTGTPLLQPMLVTKTNPSDKIIMWYSTNGAPLTGKPKYYVVLRKIVL